jgi:polar amino acid transport system permease protein
MGTTYLDMLPTLLSGAAVTLEITLLAAALGLVCSLLAGLARLSRWRLVRLVATIYVEVFRGTSTLVQLFYFFFVLPLAGIELTPFMTAVVVVGINAGAYGSEIVRAAIVNVPRSQIEAAIALNMPAALAMRRIILPQAAEAMLPPFGNLLIELMKSTSLVSLITIHELAFQGRELSRNTGRVVESYVLVLLLYFLLAFPMTRVVKWIERRVRLDLQVGPVR